MKAMNEAQVEDFIDWLERAKNYASYSARKQSDPLLQVAYYTSAFTYENVLAELKYLRKEI